MKNGRILLKAEKYRMLMNSTLKPLNEALNKIFDDYNVCFVYQESDGWCVLFDNDYNAKIDFCEIDNLLKMNREQALEFLHSKSI